MDRLALAVCSLLAAAVAGPAIAHRGHDDAIRVSTTGSAIQVSFFADAASLKAFDTNADGVLSRAEFDANASRIAQFVDECLSARDAQNADIDPIRRDQPVSGYAELAAQSPVERVRFVRHYSFEAKLDHLEFGSFPAAHGARSVISVGPIEASFAYEGERAATLSFQ